MGEVQTVFIVGATGRTGQSIVNVLLNDPKFHVIAAIRPASASKPEVNDLKARGAEILIIDLESTSVEQLQEHLKGVDTVISTLVYSQLELQKPLIYASKQAGVKRFVPDDWATPCVPGVRAYYDEKLIYHNLIKEIGLGYTFIDVGWWYQGVLPTFDDSKEFFPGFNQVATRTIYGSGDTKSALIDIRDIGKYTARIITDDRTLNKYVLAYTEELTQKEIIAIAERVLGKKVPSIQYESAEGLTKTTKAADGVMQIFWEYMYSVYVRGDNTIENAKKEEYGGALDAKELYPELELISFTDCAKEFYSQ